MAKWLNHWIFVYTVSSMRDLPVICPPKNRLACVSARQNTPSGRMNNERVFCANGVALKGWRGRYSGWFFLCSL